MKSKWDNALFATQLITACGLQGGQLGGSWKWAGFSHSTRVVFISVTWGWGLSRSHVPVETFWVLGWGDFAGWFYTNKRSLWNHINWILLSVGVGNTTESNCTIVGLKLYRRDFMHVMNTSWKWRSSKENKYLWRRSEVVTMFVYFYLSYKRNTVKVRLVQKLQIMTKIQVFSRGSTVTYWSWGLFDS